MCKLYLYYSFDTHTVLCFFYFIPASCHVLYHHFLNWRIEWCRSGQLTTGRDCCWLRHWLEAWHLSCHRRCDHQSANNKLRCNDENAELVVCILQIHVAPGNHLSDLYRLISSLNEPTPLSRTKVDQSTTTTLLIRLRRRQKTNEPNLSSRWSFISDQTGN